MLLHFSYFTDDALISGPNDLVTDIQKKLKEYFDVKFSTPKDFIGLDITQRKDGTITLSMNTFTEKLKETFQIPDTLPILTPGRTDKKIIRHDQPEPDPTYRSKVGSLMWTTMGTRYDITYTVKELSRVLQEPTKTAKEILERTLTYVTQTPQAFLEFNPAKMKAFTLPPTRKKPHLHVNIYNVDDYNIPDTIPQHDDTATKQIYTFKGAQLIITCYTDIDLAGQHETRQSTSGYMLYLNGALIHWHGRTERLIISSTAAGEYIALSRGHAACKFIKTILKFYGNTSNTYYLYTDNQAAEHIATQPTMNEHSRSIDIRHHAVRQDYLAGKLQIGGVRTDANPSDILTKYLPAPTHMRHASDLNITFPTPTIPTPKDGPSTPTTIQYTQNGNHIATPTHPTHHGQYPTYRRPTNSLPTRRSHALSRPVHDIPTRRLRHGRARVRLNQTAIHVHRQRHAVPSSYTKTRLTLNKQHQDKHTLTPGYRSPSPKLARATTGHQAIHRQRPHMRTPQHIPTQAHHAPKHARNLHPRHTYRQHCKPPTSQNNQPIQNHQVRMVSIDHSLLENHQRQQTTRTRTTRAHTHATFTKRQEQRINKWMSTLRIPHPPTPTSTNPNHPFAFKQTTQPATTATHTPCKCMANLTRGQIRQTGNKNTETKNKYNLSQTSPKRQRKSTSCSKHIDKSNKQTRTSQFNMKPNAPANKRNPANTITWTPSKQDEIDKKAKQKQKIKSPNENRRITPGMQIHPQTNQKVFPVKYRTKFPPNQNEPTHRNNLISSNKKATKIANRNDLYKNNTNAFTEIAGDNVLIVKRVDTRRRRLRSRQRRRVTRGDGQLSTSDLPTPSPPLRAPTQTSQLQILRGLEALEMRIERHELRRFSKRTMAPVTSVNEEHHTQRLRHILDVQSDVLDALNAMTKVHIDKNPECIEILYDLYTDALLFSHRGKHLAPASHPKYHTYYMVFKDLEEIINRQYSKALREHKKIRSLSCPHCDVPLDYYSSPPPMYDPPRSESPQSPAYTPTKDDDTSSTSSSEGVPEAPKSPKPSILQILSNHDDTDELKLQHLNIEKILQQTNATLDKLENKFRLE